MRTGHVTARTTCSYCDGTRIFVKYKCHECEGIGRKTYESPVELNIPPGDQTFDFVRKQRLLCDSILNYCTCGTWYLVVVN